MRSIPFFIVIWLIVLQHVSSHRFANYRLIAHAAHKATENGTNKHQTKSKSNSSNIQSSELGQVLQRAIHILSLTVEEIKQQGWKLVQNTEHFSLYKRRPQGLSDGPYEYMMIGIFNDVSPKNFLLCQTQKALRQIWDDTLGQMNVISQETTSDANFPDMDSEDSIYYRVKWPWPLKDRDYTLIRRSKVLSESNAITFISRAVEIPSCPHVKDVMRVDNYRCESAFISTASSHSESSSSSSAASEEGSKSAPHSVPHFVEHAPPVVQKVFIDVSGKIAEIKHVIHSVTHHGRNKAHTSGSVYDKPGVKFVSVFCDDQKVPLPSMIVDALSKQAERMAAQNIVKLHKTAKERTEAQ